MNTRKFSKAQESRVAKNLKGKKQANSGATLYGDIGIYRIKNKINGKIYIGQSLKMTRRLVDHRRSLIKGTHSNPHLQNAWNLYGAANFDFSILRECQKIELNNLEKYWIKAHGGCNSSNVYNQNSGGGYYSMSQESILKMRRPHSREHVLKIATSNKGKKRSPEQRACMKAAQNRPEVKLKRDSAVRKTLANPEVRKKMGEANKGRILTDDHREKLANAGRRAVKNNRPIYQLQGDRIINEWFSIRQAEETLSIYNIIKVCKGRQKLAGGFEWRYIDEYEKVQ